jgi:hypothetical protein
VELSKSGKTAEIFVARDGTLINPARWGGSREKKKAEGQAAR